MFKDLLLKQTVPQFKRWIGKKVEVKVKGERYVGILTFAGVNPIHGEFQVTLGRTPLWSVDRKTIKLTK